MIERDFDVPLEVGLRDGLFAHAKGMGFGGDAINEEPELLVWNRIDGLPVTVYTDTCLHQVEDQDWAGKKVALLIESPPFRTVHFDYAIENTWRFDHVLTFHKDLIFEMRDSRWVWYPRGGTFISSIDWKFNHDKDALVSFLASDKRGATGHDFRHDIYEKLSKEVHCFGPISGAKITRKLLSIGAYNYSIIVEGERLKGGFSDHLLDCFALETIPIYWRKYDIEEYFDKRGMICFENLDELDNLIANQINEEDYKSRIPYLIENKKRAWAYRCPEDWMVRNIPEVLTP